MEERRVELLATLGRERRASGPITPERSDAIADALGLRRGSVAEVVSSYAYLRTPVDANQEMVGLGAANLEIGRASCRERVSSVV